ncbi:antitoxin [Streptosporangiaceae bacterium NEAU-GS5]|nr:antitoxin [Streptosporangiaceae bacterium NEAU-GS5]
MRQTAVYLRDQQSRALKEAAARLERSEAELIREGVDLVLARYGPPLGRCDMPTARGGGLASRADELLADGFGEPE